MAQTINRFQPNYDKEKNIYKNIIIGATAAGIGFALKNSGSIILEPSYNLLPDFFAGMRMREPKFDKKHVTDEISSAWLDELQGKKAASETRFYPAAVAAIAARELLNHGIKTVFSAEVYDISEKNGMAAVTYYGKNGYMCVFAERVIDTTPLGAENGYFSDDRALYQRLGIYEKSISFSAVNVGGQSLGNLKHDLSFNMYKGFFENEWYAFVSLPLTATYSEARKKVISCIAESGIFQSLEPCENASAGNIRICENKAPMRAAAMSQFFNYKYKNQFPEYPFLKKAQENGKLGNRIVFLPSAAQNDFFEAFERGMSL